MASDFRAGDRVIYTDLDAVVWGPWEVVAVVNDMVTVRASGKLDFCVESRRLRKMKDTEPVSQRST